MFFAVLNISILRPKTIEFHFEFGSVFFENTRYEMLLQYKITNLVISDKAPSQIWDAAIRYIKLADDH